MHRKARQTTKTNQAVKEPKAAPAWLQTLLQSQEENRQRERQKARQEEEKTRQRECQEDMGPHTQNTLSST